MKIRGNGHNRQWFLMVANSEAKIHNVVIKKPLTAYVKLRICLPAPQNFSRLIESPLSQLEAEAQLNFDKNTRPVWIHLAGEWIP